MHSDRERVAVDAELLAAARRHYDGVGDLADQLWWLEHPGTRGPSGADDPLPRLEAARSALYRPDRAEDVDPAALQRELDRASADRASAVTALEAARADRPAAHPVERPRASNSRPVLLVLGVAATALVVGLAAGFAFGRFTLTPAPKALTIFDTGQQTHDRPPSTADLPPLAARSAYRLIRSSPSTGAYAYGVRTPRGDVCLVVVVLAQATDSACTTEAAFGVGGLTLTLSVNVDPTDDSGVSRPVGIAPHWAPDGGFTF